MAITWQNVKDLFYETIGDSENNGFFFDEATVTSFADEAIREASNRTRFSDAVAEQLSVAGDATINPTMGWFAQIWRVEYDGEKLIPITTDELRKRDRHWASRSGTPRFYMLDEYQTDSEDTVIRLFETPDAEDVLIRIYAYSRQYAINDSAPTQSLPLPEWFAYSLLFGMLERAYEADTEMQSFKKSRFYHMLWDDALGRLRARSFGRLNKQWVMRPSGKKPGLDIRNRIPQHIPEPT